MTSEDTIEGTAIVLAGESVARRVKVKGVRKDLMPHQIVNRMDHEPKETERLFSYGTLQTESVQVATFGRRLDGSPDALIGYRLRMIQITDPAFVATSGAEYHRNLEFSGSNSDVVEGTVFSVTQPELEQADAYEPEGYQRVQVRLRSGTAAWVYVVATLPTR